MKKVITNIIKLTTVTSMALFLSACSGKGNGGIDTSFVPECGEDIRDTSASIKVPAGTTVKAEEEGTTLRVWHYSNSDELICTLTGSASIVEAE